MLATKLTAKENTKENYFSPKTYPNIQVLKSAVIYGPNASGKTNVLRSLFFFIHFILDSTDYKFHEELFRRHFVFYKNALEEPTTFEITFIADDHIRYKYGFSYNKQDILEEHLYSYASSKETKLFVRKKGEKIQFSSQFRGEKKILEDQLLHNNLLLSKAANSNYHLMQGIYAYFRANFYFSLYNNDESDSVSQTSTSMIAMRAGDESFSKTMVDLLKVADSGIEGLELTEKFDEIYAIHRLYDESGNWEPVGWDLDQESSGTIRLFHLLGPIINILQKGSILVIDEINNGLHPSISEFIVKLFNSPESNPKNAQLIFTTHDVTLLNKHLFRRDQVWFTEKNNLGRTELFSLSSFDKKEVRWDVPFDRWYLSGRFGALPNIQDIKWGQSDQ